MLTVAFVGVVTVAIMVIVTIALRKWVMKPVVVEERLHTFVSYSRTNHVGDN